jgi:hypothetical protein
MLENKFKTKIINEIEIMLPGCIIFHLDANEIQGAPDLLILYKKHWAVLEGKKSTDASHRPNQDYYVNLMNDMSFARFIYPENKEEVLYELQQAFGIKRPTCLSKRKQISLDKL